MGKGRLTVSVRCGLWAASTLVAFAGCMLLSSLPGLPEPLRVALALIGYVSLVLLLSCTLRAWRSDWSELSSPPKTDHPRRIAGSSDRAPLVFRASRQSESPSRR